MDVRILGYGLERVKTGGSGGVEFWSTKDAKWAKDAKYRGAGNTARGAIGAVVRPPMRVRKLGSFGNLGDRGEGDGLNAEGAEEQEDAEEDGGDGWEGTGDRL
jgi:hypothetical protein